MSQFSHQRTDVTIFLQNKCHHVTGSPQHIGVDKPISLPFAFMTFFKKLPRPRLNMRNRNFAFKITQFCLFILWHVFALKMDATIFQVLLEHLPVKVPMQRGTCACAWMPRPVPEVNISQHRSEAVSRQASSSDGYWICFWITICQTQPQYLQIVQCCPVVSISQWQSAEPVSISICSTSASSSFWSLFRTTSWYIDMKQIIFFPLTGMSAIEIHWCCLLAF